jgi:hypothetical protein
MTDDGDCGEIGGIKIGRENRSTRRKPAPAPLSKGIEGITDITVLLQYVVHIALCVFWPKSRQKPNR